ncbi:hypothetical protein ACHAQJ_000169 [Trichoderma viride]
MDLQASSDATHTINALQNEHDIQRIDVVVANAGILDSWRVPVVEIADAQLLSHFNANALSLLRLFKAVVPLMNQAHKPKLVYVSASAASISTLDTLSNTTEYGISKMAGNFLMKMISIQHRNVIAFCVCPGLVSADISNLDSTRRFLERGPITMVQRADGIVHQIDSASQQTTGRFLNFAGREIPW